MARCDHGFELTVVPCDRCRSPIPPRTINRSNNVIDLTGQAFAGATVLSRADNDARGSVTWHVRLTCGHTKRVSGVHLRQQAKTGGRIRCAEGCGTYARRSPQ